MIRVSVPSAILIFAFWRSRGTSCVGGSSTRSTSPDSSAAARVASDLIGVYTISVTLPSGLSHQSGFAISTVFTSGSRDFSMNWPVPLVLRAAKLSSFCT